MIITTNNPYTPWLDKVLDQYTRKIDMMDHKYSKLMVPHPLTLTHNYPVINSSTHNVRYVK